MHQYSKVLKQVASFSFTILIALVIRWGFAEAYVIPTGSMEPTLLIHDHIFVNKWIYGLRVPFTSEWLMHFQKPKRGEVIVFKDPKQPDIFLIKRVIGLPGDKIEYRANQLVINGEAVENSSLSAPATPQDHALFRWLDQEPLETPDDAHLHDIETIGGHRHAVLHRQSNSESEAGPLIVPDDSLFVMGDHRDNSYDSRGWGFVPRSNILGRAMFVWMSCGDSLGGSEIGCNPSTIRWARLLDQVN